MTCILTHTGRYLDFTEPDAYPYPIEEIALALSREHRFSGHGLDRSVTVLEHSLRVYHLTHHIDPRVRLAALLHDAHEAYVKDIPTPLKRLIGPAYVTIEKEVQAAMLAAHGLGTWHVEDPAIEVSDHTALRIERAGSMPIAIESHPHGFPPKSPDLLRLAQARRLQVDTRPWILIDKFLLAYYEELTRCA